MDHPAELKYSKEHEWIKIDGDVVLIGITDYAQDSLGDVVYLELPDEGDAMTRDDGFGVVESVKAVSDLYAPVSGTVTEINDSLVESPEIINDDPYGEAWMVKVELASASELDELLSAAEYIKYIEEES